MIIKFRDIIRLGYFWFFRLRSGNDYKKYLIIKSTILIDYLKIYIKNSGYMLEVGVQSGEMTPFLREISSSVVSIDIDKSHLLLAKKKSPDSEVICCDILHPPFKQNVFDAIVLNSVIEHIKDDDLALIENYKLLKNYGYIYIGFPPWYNIFGGHSSIPFFSLLPSAIRNKLSKYKFARVYPTYPRSVKGLEKKLKEFFITINRNSMLLPSTFIRYPFYEFDLFVTFICIKKPINEVPINKLWIKNRDHYESNATELREYWNKIDFHL